MVAAGLVIVGQNHNIGAVQKLAMLRSPFAGAHCVASGRHVPRPQQVSLGFTLDNHNKIAVGDCFDELRQSIGYDANAIDVVNPFARFVRIRPLLAKALFVLAIFENERAVRISIFEAPDFEQHRAAFIMVIIAIANGYFVVIVEGEAKADLLWSWNVPATCNAMGAGKWRSEHSEFLRGTDVVILPDNDEPGRNHADLVATSLQGIAKSVRVLELLGLAPKGDVIDWAKHGGTVEQLRDLIRREAKPWTPRPKLLEHVHRIYPNDAEHIIPCLAHRVQRPAEKINHALILGGKQGSA